jgi:hypothetical protein
MACADPRFPGVYARVSHDMLWIRTEICQRSVSPPDYLRCQEGDLLTAPPTETPTTPPTAPPIDQPIVFALELQLDFWGEDIGKMEVF